MVGQHIVFILATFWHLQVTLLIAIHQFHVKNLGHVVHDLAPRHLCCDGKYFSGCQSRYYDKRPNDDCSNYPQRPLPGNEIFKK